MNLASAFAAITQRSPEKAAVLWGDAEFSYGHLLKQALWLADRLKSDFGIRPRDRVGIWLKNCPQFIPALFGIWQAGAVVVPINNFLKPDEMNFILADAGIDLLIT